MVVTKDGGGGGTPDVISPESIGTVATFLDAIEVDSETVGQIVQILNQGADGLDGRVFEPVPGDAFGASNTGSQLGYHTGLAHQKVTEAMNQMMDDLLNIEDKVLSYQKSQEYNDDMTRVTLENFVDSLGGIFGRGIL